MTIEPKLIEDCIKGKRSSQNELYKLTYRYLMSICIRYTHNQDRANETLNLGFFKILKYLNTYRTNEPFKPWIRKVMINTLIKEYKKEKSQKLNLVYVEDYHDSEKYSELNSIMDKINSEQIYKFIALLPPPAGRCLTFILLMVTSTAKLLTCSTFRKALPNGTSTRLAKN